MSLIALIAIFLAGIGSAVTGKPGMPTGSTFSMKDAPGNPQVIEGHSIKVFENIIKSDQDKCNYRLLTLENGLQALLISEPGLDKASAALDVHVGNFYDPKNIPGLAHFLEHLLFMGTEKYPDENEYGQFLSAHGGHSNAFTAEEHTNYFFDVTADHLEGALDRFAQFFIAPLFNPSGTERELLAVDSEHKKNLKNDHWRINQLEKTLSNETHPYYHFGTGNLETLKDQPIAKGLDIRQVLIEFYKRHYSANLMKLVIYGKDSLDDLASMAVSKFSKVPNHNFTPQIWEGKPLDERHFGKLVRVRTVKEMRTLYIVWQLPDMLKHNLEKPEHYYSHLLGHEGHGSILSLLKSRGWVTSLSAGSDTDSRGYALFQISIKLSNAGLTNVEEIVRVIFEYLQMLRKQGPQERIFNETQRIEEIAFRFMEKGQPSSFAYQTAGHMQSYPPALILKGPRVSMSYDAGLISDLLAHLSPDNFRIFIATSNPLEERPNVPIQKEKWYETEYTVEPISKELMEFIRNPMLNAKELHLPAPNEYLPGALNSKMAASLIPVMHPDLLVDDGQFKLWHKQDDVFEMPKGCFQFILLSPVAYSSPYNFVRTYLFIELLRDSLTEVVYEAEMAGLHFDIGQSTDGIYFSFCGYDEKLPLLLKEVMTRVVTFAVDPSRFIPIKDKYARWLRSIIHDTPYSLISYYLNGVQLERHWWYWEKEAILDDVTISDINNIVGELFSRANIEALCHGNYRKEEALNMLSEFRRVLGDISALPPLEAPNTRVISLNARQDLLFSPKPIPNGNSAIEFYLQIGSLGNLRLRTLTMLFTQIFHEPFFDLLRTKEQLGYIVRHQTREKGTSIGLRFVIQSERDPVYLDGRIEAFISQTVDHLNAMKIEEFNANVSALVNNLLAKKRRMADETHVYWHQILLHQYEYERAFVDAAYLQRLTKSDLLGFIHNHVLIESPERRKLAIHLWSDSLAEQRKDAYANLPESRRFFEEPAELTKSVGLFPLIYPVTDIGIEASSSVTQSHKPL